MHVVGGEENRVVRAHFFWRGSDAGLTDLHILEYDEPGIQHLDAARQAICESLLWTVVDPECVVVSLR